MKDMETDEFEGMTTADGATSDVVPAPAEGSVTTESVEVWQRFLLDCFDEYPAEPICGTIERGTESWQVACEARRSWRQRAIARGSHGAAGNDIHFSCFMALDTGVPNKVILSTYALLFR
jgi:hypothetical protein